MLILCLSQRRRAHALMRCRPVRRFLWGGKGRRTELCPGSHRPGRSVEARRFHETPAPSEASPSSPRRSSLPVWGPTLLTVWSASGLCARHV